MTDKIECGESEGMSISKELLSAVLGQNIVGIPNVPKDFPSFVFYNIESKSNIISLNVYELAHRCKEWAFDQDLEVVAYLAIGYEKWFAQVENVDDVLFMKDNIDTEPEAIFKACEWILNRINKEKK